MAFQFQDSMVNEYLSQGYLIFRGIVPPSLLSDLRKEAEKARDLAHKLNGPQTQRIQPLSNYGDELNLKPFYDYTELPELRDATQKLLGDNYTHGHVDIMGLLVEPCDHPLACRLASRWGLSRCPLKPAMIPSTRNLLKSGTTSGTSIRLTVQFMPIPAHGSCPAAISASGICPANSRQQATPLCGKPADGQSTVEAERFYLDHCRQFPGAVQVHLGPGRFYDLPKPRLAHRKLCDLSTEGNHSRHRSV